MAAAELCEADRAAGASNVLWLMDALEDYDDVQHVYANFDIDEKEIQAAVAG